MTKLYNDLASDWYQLMTPLHEYEEEAELYHQVIRKRCKPLPLTILELGCGAGHIAYYLKQWYQLSLSDTSENMLAISRKINPDCEHFMGDMRTLRLNRTFDMVFIHDAIMYMVSEQDVQQALSTAFIHCKPGGATLISPDFVKETFKAGTDEGGSDGNNSGLRYLEWRIDPDPADSTYTVDYAFLMRSASGEVKVEHDHHVEGLFAEKEWLNMLKGAGFQPVAIPDSFERINFLAFKSTG